MTPSAAGHPARGAMWRWFRLGLAILLAGLSMSVSLALNLESPEGMTRTMAHAVLASVTALGLGLLGWPILRGALVPRLTLEHLYLVGLGGAFAASLYSSVTGIGHIYYEVVLILLAIYHFGQLALRASTDKAADLARHIPGLKTTAQIVEGGQIHEIPAREVRTGQHLRVEAGGVVPADGVITDGRAFVEELAHTGEPFPAVRQPGDRLLAGSRVLDGIVDLRATANGRDRELDRLLAACQDARPGPAENLARRVLGFFVPLVIGIALATAVTWAFLLQQPAQALFNALAVTIVACPCALGLAIPMAARQTLVRLRLLGLLPQTPDLVERLAVIDTVAFDKTGTLSHPRLGLDRLETRPGAPADLAAWLAAIQRTSTHPVARPFWTLKEPAELTDLEVTPLPAVGLEARFLVDGRARTLRIGNDLLIGESAASATRRLHVLLDDQPVATAWLAESPRESALATVGALQEGGLEGVLLTGDTACPEAYNKVLGVHTRLTAAAKAAWLRGRQAAGRHVLFVGDGMNDAEGLRAAHVGLALRSGAGAAAATADAVLVHDDLSVLPQALEVARRTRRRLTRLLAFSLIYNACGMTLAATGFLHPVAAALLMLASSATVLAVVNCRT